MTTIDYKEKYEAALERCKKLYNEAKANGYTSDIEDYETIFPELKESEDDRMRAMAIKAVHAPEAQSCIKGWGINPDDVIAWLEKQGEKGINGNKGEFPIPEPPLTIKHAKEVMEIEQKPADETPYPETLEKAIDLYYYSYGNGEGEFEHLSLEKFRDIVHTFVSDYGQKPAWSEDDEDMFKRFVDLIPQYMTAHGYNELFNWLKSLKERVLPQPKQEWSEEDKTIIDSLLDVLYRIKKGKDSQATTRLIEQHINFIESLKERYAWKPSDEQMEALKHYVDTTMDGEIDLLYQDLKKLKG